MCKSIIIPGASQSHSQIVVNSNPPQAVLVIIQCSAPQSRSLRQFWKSACWFGPTCAAPSLYTEAPHLLPPLLRPPPAPPPPPMAEFRSLVRLQTGGVCSWSSVLIRRRVSSLGAVRCSGVLVSEGDLFPCGAGAWVAVWQLSQQVAAKGRGWFSYRDSESWGPA